MTEPRCASALLGGIWNTVPQGNKLLILIALFGIGALMLSAGLIVLPYRRRFLRRIDRTAFLFSTLLSSGLGALIAAGSGAFLCLSLLGG